jgi:hypothetical protein
MGTGSEPQVPRALSRGACPNSRSLYFDPLFLLRDPVRSDDGPRVAFQPQCGRDQRVRGTPNKTRKLSAYKLVTIIAGHAYRESINRFTAVSGSRDVHSSDAVARMLGGFGIRREQAIQCELPVPE